MLLLPGTRTWRAEDGCYMVVPFQSIENAANKVETKNPLYSDKTQAINVVGTDQLIQVGWTPTYTTIEIAGVSQHLFPVHKTAPVHSAGMALIGLNPQAAITLTVNLYYEYFPNSSEPDLVTLARPSASFDPVALGLYSEALKSLPVGVPASMNGLGDWFAGVVSKFAPALGMALTPVLGPGAFAIGNIAKGIADNYLASNNPNTKPKLGPPPPLPPRLPAPTQQVHPESRPLQARKPKKKKKKKAVQSKRK